MPASFDIDCAKKEALLFNKRETTIGLSIMTQVGRAVAALLSLPVEKEKEGKPCLEELKNQAVYVNLCTVSQKDTVASAYRVPGKKEEKWKISREGVRERYTRGSEDIKGQKRSRQRKMMEGRVFFDMALWNDISKVAGVA
ncbi:MAG: hypothetical protein Q9165_000992 [Trypethelium subeluteriae]